jgi:ABC-type spermidine/putrescine transport system permease subunit II
MAHYQRAFAFPSFPYAALAEVTIAACTVVCISTLCAILFAFSLTLPLNRLSELLQRVALMVQSLNPRVVSIICF